MANTADKRAFPDLLDGFLHAAATASDIDRTASATALLCAAEASIAAEDLDSVAAAEWRRYLDITARPEFLTALDGREACYRWAETTFAVVAHLDFTLEDLFAQRCQRLPDRTLFHDLSTTEGSRWSYRQVRQRIRETAAVFLGETDATAAHPGAPGQPRVALFTNNSVDAACCDLACLFYDILVSPLNIHFETDNLVWICDRLQIDTVVTDENERLDKLLKVREQVQRPFHIYLLNACGRPGLKDVSLLPEARAILAVEEIDARLAKRPRFGLRDVCTVMFTSGSTGWPKGVAFSQYSLVTKRFARHAALPTVGEDEVMLCYLPLFHTFGRYLELLGSIYWGGTYVFSGPGAAETLLNQFSQIQPTALISIPLRWQQIYDRVDEICTEESGLREPEEVMREIVGERLGWGLSAAGYLSPKTFRFFHRQGVRLCSGFGMTEGTGGLTMTPPDEYVAGSVGIPLPGVRIRFADQGELQIAGPYIARYLPEEDAPGSLQVEDPDSDDYWLSTGDLFVQRGDGHLEIVDRIKDIYKNNRGQTIAPRKVEAQFTAVPGIERTFLVGDSQAYNTLLIVPDRSDEIFRSFATEEDEHEYFNQIVTQANIDLAPYERVVNFAVLGRDFSADEGELTPKGSYKRKAITQNFQDKIQDLYQTNILEIAWEGLRILVPRWIFRDLGILEGAIQADAWGLIDLATDTRLPLQRDPTSGRILIGDLEYRIDGDTMDLGIFARQPLLWVGNPSLTAFCPCKVGWDTPLGAVAEQVWLPDRDESEIRGLTAGTAGGHEIEACDLLCQQALFGPTSDALHAIAQLAEKLRTGSDRFENLIRRRLEALACHPAAAVRSRAYQVLVLDEPVPDYSRYLPAFIESGRTFLDDDSIQAIAQTAYEPRRLQAFRRRLHSYRTQLTWPADAARRRVFDDLFRLLADFARFHPEYYAPVREELVSWVLHDSDPVLAEHAEQHFHELAAWFESKLRDHSTDLAAEHWQGKIAFQEGLTAQEIERLEEVLIGTTFLGESVQLAFEGEVLSLDEIDPGGIWVSRIHSHHDYSRYRVSINTRQGKHFDLQLTIREDLDEGIVMETIFWIIAIRGYPHGAPVLPAFGCCRPELGALSLSYVSDLTVWEKIREFSSVRGPGTRLPSKSQWRRLFVSAMATLLRGWRASGRRIIPGSISPNNVVVPDPDFREGGLLNSLSGWTRYDGPISLIRPLVMNFFRHTISHYPWCQDHLHLAWIFDACVEALGVDETRQFLAELAAEIESRPDVALGADFATAMTAFRDELERDYYVPLALHGALDRYRDWERVNHQATAKARLEILDELRRLYRLDRYGEIARYQLYRHTYFAQATPEVQDVFDRLLERMFQQPGLRATQLVELSDLQAALSDADDRRVFRRLAFPRLRGPADVEVMTVGDRERSHVIVRSHIADRRGESYTVGEPTGAAEVGQVYRLFLLEGYPKTVSKRDRYLVVTNSQEQVVGGICYQLRGDGVVHLDGVVVVRALHERSITGTLLEDFCIRMTEAGQRVIKTHFYLRDFYQRHGFRVDQRWGGLVRFL